MDPGFRFRRDDGPKWTEQWKYGLKPRLTSPGSKQSSNSWGGSRDVVVHGQLFDAATLPALIAGDRLGLLTYRADPPRAEIVTLNALAPRQGIGSALIVALAAELAARGVREVRVTMTNDNLDALRFYQRRGFRLAALRPGAVDAARHLKPAIPVAGNYGIARHDEIELVLGLD